MEKKRVRPLPTKKERIGVFLIVVLMFIEYFISISILSGEMDTQFIYHLDLTGQLAIEGVRWANGSVVYRDLMIPVYISANIFLYAVILVTFVTRDWKNIAEWENNISYKWMFIQWGIVIFLYLFSTSFIGEGEIIHNINDLGRSLEKRVLNNKYHFILILIFLACCGYQFAMALAVTILKVKKIKPVFVLNELFKERYSIKECPKCNGKMKCIGKKHFRVLDTLGFLVIASIPLFFLIIFITSANIWGEWYGVLLIIIFLYASYWLWEKIGYNVVTYCRCQSCRYTTSLCLQNNDT